MHTSASCRSPLRVGRVVAGLVAAAITLGCTSTSTAPNPIEPGDAPTGSGTISGVVTSHLTGVPVAGATVSMGVSATVTNAAGEFTLTSTPTSGVGNIIASAPGFVLRGVSVTLAAQRTGIQIDMIRDAAPFSLQFYRAWARDLFSSVEMQTLRTWTKNPNFYFKTSLEDTGAIVPADVIARIVSNFTGSIPELSGGKRAIGMVETGTDAREIQDGWVNVLFYQVTPSRSLGSTSVGGDAGQMVLFFAPELLPNPQNNPFGCDTVLEAVVDHEITHVMGYFHTLDIVGDTFSGPGCAGSGRPDNTQFHSAIAYARPRGNRDPDLDPNTVVQMQASVAGSPPVVFCFRQ